MRYEDVVVLLEQQPHGTFVVVRNIGIMGYYRKVGPNEWTKVGRNVKTPMRTNAGLANFLSLNSMYWWVS